MMIPITRKEKYINEIVGGGNTAPETPQTREELFFADILGEVVAPSPITRIEKYLAKIANKYSGELPEPVTRIERFLARAAGMNVSIPTPVTREEMFWADYALIVEKELSDIPPLTFNAIAGTLKNYRIYGNTVNGDSVGNRTANLFDGFIQGIRLNTSTGLEEKNNTSYTSGFIGVENDNLYSYSGGSDTTSIAFFAYDSSKNYIGRSTSTIRTDTIIYTSTTFSNYTSFSTNLTGNINPIAYIRITHVNAEQTVIDDEQIMLNSGSTLLPYEPYGYKVPVTVEGKNLFLLPAKAETIERDGIIFTANENGTYTAKGTALTNTRANFKLQDTFIPPDSLASGGQGVLHLYNSATPTNTASAVFLRQEASASQIVQKGYVNLNSGNRIISNYRIDGEINMFGIYVVAGAAVDIIVKPAIYLNVNEYIPYEPYHAPVTTPIYLPEPIKMVGNDAEYVDFVEQKQYFADGTSVDVELPALPTLSGTNTLTVGTEVQPSNVYIKYEEER